MSIAVAIGLTALTSLAVGLLVLPLLARQHRPRSREAYNLAVYRDQLAEIDRDLARGLLSAEQAEAARAEIGRRILALDDGGNAARGRSREPLAAAVVAILAMPVAALLIYAAIGSPGLPDQPFAERAERRGGNAADDAATMSMQEALAKLRAHLKAKPDDLTGWLLLARSEVGLGRYQRGRRGLWPRRRAVVESPRHRRRMGRGAGPGGRLGHAGGGKGVRGRIEGPGERAEIALLSRSREAGAGRPARRVAGLGRSRRRFAARRPMAAAAAPAHRRGREGGGHRPGLANAVRRASARTGAARRKRRARTSADRACRRRKPSRPTAKATAGRLPRGAPRDDREHGRAARFPPRTAARRRRGLGPARTLVHGAASAREGARRLRPRRQAPARRRGARAGPGRGDKGRPEAAEEAVGGGAANARV